MRVLLVLSSLASLVLGYSVNDFPNPKTNFAACGMRSISRVCDPDKVLSEGDRYRLNTAFVNLASRSEGVGNDYCDKKGLEGNFVAVAQGDQNFANALYDRWQTDAQCGKAVLVLFSKSDNKLYVAGASRAGIPDTQASEIIGQANTQLAGQGVIPAVEGALRSFASVVTQNNSNNSSNNNNNNNGNRVPTDRPTGPGPMRPGFAGGSSSSAALVPLCLLLTMLSTMAF